MRKGQQHTLESRLKMGKSRKGLIISEAARLKLSQRMKNNSYAKGKKHKLPRSQEYRAKMSKLHKGKIISEEHKRRLSVAYKGKMLGKDNPSYKHGKCNTSEMARFYELRRNCRKNSNGGTHTFYEWDNLKIQYNYTCPCCKKSEPEICLSEDHIIPISKGGSNSIENIQPLCRSCNYKKHTDIIKYEK